MALRNQPYIPLYVQDYLTDEKLNECSPATQGIYIKIMCILHKSETYGSILLKQKDKQNESSVKNFALKIARLLPFREEEIESALSELLENDVMNIAGDTLFQKRMVRDGELSDKRALAGSRGGNSKSKQGNLLKQKDKQNESKCLSESEANSEYENEYEYEIDIKNKNESSKSPSKTTKPKIAKGSYGEYLNVKLTSEEHQKLIDEYGMDVALQAIEFLSAYREEKGYKNKSDYLSIRRWVIGAVKEREDKPVKPTDWNFMDLDLGGEN